VKSFENSLIIKIVTLFIIPYIFVLALYIQINGEASPGGGFQAGAIFASCLIAYEMIYGKEIFKRYYSIELLVSMSVIGTLIYLVVGFISLIFDYNFMSYSYLYIDEKIAQGFGIFLIEIGVGFTVSAIMCLIYTLFRTS